MTESKLTLAEALAQYHEADRAMQTAWNYLGMIGAASIAAAASVHSPQPKDHLVFAISAAFVVATLMNFGLFWLLDKRRCHVLEKVRAMQGPGDDWVRHESRPRTFMIGHITFDVIILGLIIFILR